MAKKIDAYIKLQVKAGMANPAPPIGPALGSKGVNIMEFCKQFNAATQDRSGTILPVVITVYSDKSFTFIVKSPPAPVLVKQYADVKSGAADPLRQKVGSITWDQCLEIAKIKEKDMQGSSLEAKASQVAGTARSMGITVSGQPE